MKRKKIIIYVVVSCFILAAILTYSFTNKSNSGYVFETAKVERGSINNAITATGTLEATNTVEVGTQVSGVIEKLYVDFNSIVKKGELIAELDKSTLLSSLETAQAELNRAEAEFEYQSKNLERMKTLFDKDVLSQSDYDEAVYNYKLTKASVKSAKANVEKAERNLGYATIYSPIDGVVLNRAVEEGQTVAASMSTPELFTITNDLSVMQVEADVDEADIGMVKVGQKVDFTVDAFPDDTFTGAVSEIRLQPNEESNVITYTVIVAVENPDKKLKPGMTASITAYVEEANDVLLAAGKAVRFTPDSEVMKQMMESMSQGDMMPPQYGERPPMMEGNGDMQEMPGPPPGMGEQEEDDSHKTLWVKDGEMIHPVRVETGINDGTQIEILSGLNEGDEVVVGMTEGTAQDVENEDEDADEEESSPFVQQHKDKKGGPGGPPPM